MPVKFDNSLIYRIQQSTDIVDVISEHLSLQKKGKELVGLCPFHADHKPSMYVNPVKQIFKCFACGAGGDVFKFIQLRENLSFPDAIERLAARAGIKLPTRQPRRNVESHSSDQGPKEVARINMWAQKFFQANLHDKARGSSARKYIEERGINSESVTQWSLGLSAEEWNNLTDAAAKKNVSGKSLTSAGLAVARDDGRCYDKFRNRLMFPIFDVTGDVVGFGGRTLGDDPAKYMNSPATMLFDKSNCLYGLDKARHKIVSDGTAVVVEGYTDVIMAHQFGCSNVIATLGTSLTPGHVRILRRYAKRIVLIFDGDTAGIEAANRALEVGLSEKVDIKLAFMPKGKDPCDFLLDAGTEAFAELIDNAVDAMAYKWQRLIEGLKDSDNLTDRRAVTEEYLRTVAMAMTDGRVDPIADGLIGSKLSRIIGLSEEQTRRHLGQLTRRLGGQNSYSVKNQRVVSTDYGDGPFAGAQREVLEVLVNEPGLFETVKGKISAEHFDAGNLREIAQALFELLEKGHQPSLAQLLAGIESVEAGRAVVKLAEVGQMKGNFEPRLKEAVEVFDSHREGVRKNKIKATLSDDDTESLRKITETLSKRNKRCAGMRAK